jgi:hypothetical protein
MESRFSDEILDQFYKFANSKELFEASYDRLNFAEALKGKVCIDTVLIERIRMFYVKKGAPLFQTLPISDMFSDRSLRYFIFRQTNYTLVAIVDVQRRRWTSMMHRPNKKYRVTELDILASCYLRYMRLKKVKVLPADFVLDIYSLRKLISQTSFDDEDSSEEKGKEEDYVPGRNTAGWC